MILVLPATKGILGGLYCPYLYGIDYGIGTESCWGKSVISSGDGSLLDVGGFKISGGVINGSFKCAYPSTSIVERFLYLAAFFNIWAINNIL
jgi:hypothetical protein